MEMRIKLLTIGIFALMLLVFFSSGCTTDEEIDDEEENPEPVPENKNQPDSDKWPISVTINIRVYKEDNLLVAAYGSGGNYSNGGAVGDYIDGGGTVNLHIRFKESGKQSLTVQWEDQDYASSYDAATGWINVKNGQTIYAFIYDSGDVEVEGMDEID